MAVGFKSHYFKDLAELEAGNFWFRGRNKLILWALHKYSPELKSFLEIGCGTGFVISAISKQFPRRSYRGASIWKRVWCMLVSACQVRNSRKWTHGTFPMNRSLMPSVLSMCWSTSKRTRPCCNKFAKHLNQEALCSSLFHNTVGCGVRLINMPAMSGDTVPMNCIKKFVQRGFRDHSKHFVCQYVAAGDVFIQIIETERGWI